MKSLRTISAISLAVLVMLSSSSFMVGMHWCGGHLQDFAWFTKADVCPMEKNFPPCHKPIKNKCCEDQTVVHESSGFHASATTISFELPFVVDLPMHAALISEIVPESSTALVLYSNYDPPTFPVDVTVDLQVFLI